MSCKKRKKMPNGGDAPLTDIVLPEVTVYSKAMYNKLLSDNEIKKAKYLADMQKYKKDSAEWVTANKMYQDSLRSYNFTLKQNKFYNDILKKEFVVVNNGNTNDSNADILEKRMKDKGNADFNEYVKIHDTLRNLYNEEKTLNPKIKPIKTSYLETDRDEHDSRVKGNVEAINRFKLTSKPEYLYDANKNDYGKPKHIPSKPVIPSESTETIIKYDSKYENLKMRSLWANKAKQDTTAKIGVLNPLDYNDETKGFTIDEASKFPQEIKDKFNLNYIDTMKPKKKMALGGIDPISLVSIGATLYNNREAKLAQDAAASFAKAEQDKQRLDMDSIALENFNQSGTDKYFYANGGMFQLNRRTDGNVKGFKYISPNVMEVVGPKHSNGGVPIGDVEVEGGELIKINPNNTMSVLSDRKKVLGYSPADKVKKCMYANLVEEMFNTEMAKQEVAKMADGGTLPWETFYKATGASINTPFSTARPTSNVWESTKPVKNVGEDPIYGDGVNPNKNKQSKLPYFIDNIANLATTLGTPNVQKPVLTPNVNLNTDVNVDPLIGNVKENERSAMRGINANISDSNVATALGIGVGNTATKSINDIRADEFNKESELQNKETMMNTQINMANNNLVNEYMNENTQRQLGINAGLNKNIENLTRDLIDIQDKKNLNKRDIDRVKLELTQDYKGVLADAVRTTGAFDDAILSGDIDIARLHPDTAKAIAEKRTQLLMKSKSR